MDQHEDGILRAAIADGIRGDRVEHGLNVRGRPGDRAKDLRRGGLPLERLLRLLEQPDVLDRDDGLVREAFHQCDLLCSKGADRRAPQGDDTDRPIVLQQRHGEERAEVAKLLRFAKGVRGIGEDIGNVDRAPLGERATGG